METNNSVNKWDHEVTKTDSSQNMNTMVKEHMKTCSASLAIREMQTRITLGFHLILVRKSVIRKTKSNMGTDIGKGSPCYTACDNGKHQCLETSVAFLITKNRSAT